MRKLKYLVIFTLVAFVAVLEVTLSAEPEMLGPDKWPTTVQATVSDIHSGMSAEDKERIRKTKKEDLIVFHHGWGTGIRNYYGLWRGNKRLLIAACGKPCHPDEASMVIIEAVWEESKARLDPMRDLP